VIENLPKLSCGACFSKNLSLAPRYKKARDAKLSQASEEFLKAAG
jgi:hypothetical protein